MNLDLGLGKVTYLMWLDMFNLLQILCVVAGVLESVAVHYLLKTQHDRLAITLDRVLRIAIPGIVYPLLTIAGFVVGISQTSLCPHTDLCGMSLTGLSSATIEQHAGRWTNTTIALVAASAIGLVGIILMVAMVVCALLNARPTREAVAGRAIRLGCVWSCSFGRGGIAADSHAFAARAVTRALAGRYT